MKVSIKWDPLLGKFDTLNAGLTNIMYGLKKTVVLDSVTIQIKEVNSTLCQVSSTLCQVNNTLRQANNSLIDVYWLLFFAIILILVFVWKKR